MVVRPIFPHVYVGETRYQDGTPVYFGFEEITPKNAGVWQLYSARVDALCQDARGTLTVTAIFLRDNNPCVEQYPDDVKKIFGFSEEEYPKFIDELRAKDPKKLAKALPKICAGTAGFDISALGNDFIVYAAKVPITKTFSVPDGSALTVKGFFEQFSNILMSVRSRDLPDTPVFENRGIFRNPISVINKDYPNLALALHRFSGLCMQDLFKGQKKYMQVSPVEPMQKILCDHFAPDQLFIGTNKRQIQGYPAYKPLFHCNAQEVLKIAREDVDVIQCKELATEQTQYEYPLGGHLSIRTNGIAEEVNLLNLKALMGSV